MMAAIAGLSVMHLVLYGVIAGAERLVVYWQAPEEQGWGRTA